MRCPALQWAWRILDWHRAYCDMSERQIELALGAIGNVFGVRIQAGVSHADEDRLRAKAAPK